MPLGFRTEPQRLCQPRARLAAGNVVPAQFLNVGSFLPHVAASQSFPPGTVTSRTPSSTPAILHVTAIVLVLFIAGWMIATGVMQIIGAYAIVFGVILVGLGVPAAQAKS